MPDRPYADRPVIRSYPEENMRQKVHALVFVGDAMEEIPADLYAAARELGVPAFMFQEGRRSGGDHGCSARSPA